jgi:AcrR family transcriptional regulator
VAQRTQARRRLTQAEKREANRTRILQAARKVVGRRGYHGATIEEIADDAGLSNGAVYYNFANKEELFFTLLETWRAELIDDVENAVGRSDRATTDGQVHEEVRRVVKTLERGREWRLLLLEFVTYASRNPKFRARFVSGRQKFKTALTNALDDFIAAFDLEPIVPPEQLAVLVTALVNGLAVEELTEPGAVADGLLETAVTAFLQPGRQPATDRSDAPTRRSGPSQAR